MCASEKAEAPPKGRMGVLKEWVQILAVPLTIAWVGNSYSASIKDSENRIRYVELAIAQLHSSPTPETAALRDWAVELLDRQSPVKLLPTAKAQLKSHTLPMIQLSATTAGAVATGTGTLSAGQPSTAN